MTAATVVAALVLGGCAGSEQHGTAAQRVTTWVKGSGAGASIGAVGATSRSIDRALADHQPAGVVKTLCVALGNAAQSANGDLPAPDQQLTSDLSKAYKAAFSAGEDCYHGAGGDAALLARSAKERARAAVLLSAAVARITQVTGQVPSTTTTTGPPVSGDPFAG